MSRSAAVADALAAVAASIRGTGMVGAVGGPADEIACGMGGFMPIGAVAGAAGAGGSGATGVGAVDSSTTRFAKFGGPSPMLHHSTTRPLGRCSTTMP
ncbi:hypothetical protein ACWESM_21445 [Nocardia sp. NPDC003999]